MADKDVAHQPLSHREWCIAFVHGFMGSSMDFEDYDAKPKVGDLVLLRSAPPSLWSISYIVDYRPIVHDGREIDTQWTLRALGTDHLCNWSNVGFRIFRRKSLTTDPDEFSGIFHDPRLKLSEPQFEFYRAWTAEGAKADLYILLQTMPRFEGNAVTCGWRIRFGFYETETPPAVFDDYTKVTRKEMREAIKAAEAFHEAEADRRKKEREDATLAVAQAIADFGA